MIQAEPPQWPIGLLLHGSMLVLLAGCIELDRQRPTTAGPTTDGQVTNGQVTDGQVTDGLTPPWDASSPDQGPATDLTVDGSPPPKDVGPIQDKGTPPDSCPTCTGGLDCLGGECRCIQGGSCFGCCLTDKACVQNPSTSHCGVGGTSCTACSDTSADTCTSAGKCACGSSDPCPAGLQCTSGSCQLTAGIKHWEQATMAPVNCPGSTVPLGGGVRCKDGETIYVNGPFNQTGWWGMCSNGVTPTVWVICGDSVALTSATLFTASKTYSCCQSDALVSCPASHATALGGGGWCKTRTLVATVPAYGDQGWRAMCDSQGEINAYSRCIEASLAVAMDVTRHSTTSGGGTSLILKCPAGKRLVGGGCKAPVGVGLKDSYPVDMYTWRCGASASVAELTAYVVCAR